MWIHGIAHLDESLYCTYRTGVTNLRFPMLSPCACGPGIAYSKYSRAAELAVTNCGFIFNSVDGCVRRSTSSCTFTSGCGMSNITSSATLTLTSVTESWSHRKLQLSNKADARTAKESVEIA
jgi:hypothetical protein